MDLKVQHKDCTLGTGYRMINKTRGTLKKFYCLEGERWNTDDY